MIAARAHGHRRNAIHGPRNADLEVITAQAFDFAVTIGETPATCAAHQLIVPVADRDGEESLGCDLGASNTLARDLHTGAIDLAYDSGGRRRRLRSRTYIFIVVLGFPIAIFLSGNRRWMVAPHVASVVPYIL